MPQRLVEQMTRLPEPSPSEAVRVCQRGGHPQGNLGFTRIAEAEVDRRSEVGHVALHSVEPAHLPRANPVGVRLPNKPLEPVQVPAAQWLRLARLFQLRPPEVAERLQQPVPSDVGGPLSKDY